MINGCYIGMATYCKKSVERYFFVVKRQLPNYCEYQINITPFTVAINDPEGGNFLSVIFCLCMWLFYAIAYHMLLSSLCMKAKLLCPE